jgi:choline dehydrogenase-like flavoprotein
LRASVADILIIGAGASGSVAAARLAEEGFRVVCLEQGDHVDRRAIPTARPEWELLIQKQWSLDPNVRGLPSDYPINTQNSDIAPLMFNGVGGSTVMYGAHWMRLLPSDFRMRSLDGVGDDWPLDYEELVPYYERIDSQVGVSGLKGDPAYPAGREPPLPPLPIGKIGRVAARGMEAMGWHWWPGSNAIASRAYRNLAACTLRGTCDWGCPEGAKASFDRTHWPIALAGGADLITGARVRELPVDKRGLVTGAVYVDRNGREHFQPAGVVMLAANGIGTPRLLLLSTSTQFPDGLANSSGLVGRRLMMHPYAQVVGVFEEDLASWVGPWGQLIYSLQFYETDEALPFLRGAKWAAMPLGGPLITLEECAMGRDDVWGADFHSNMRRWFGHTFFWGMMADDLPVETNTVTLDEQLTDADGIPAPKVTYTVSENSRQILEFNMARAREALEAAGAIETMSNVVRETGWHLLGTARMGNDPATSVVDPWGRSHDVANLYIIDGSVFVTGGGLNPTATICALALRSVEHLITQRRHQEVPLDG